MPTPPSFSPDLFKFLRDLAKNNDRAWFEENRERYERWYRDAGLRFVTTAGPLLAKVSPHVLADPRPVGGSLMRIHRDTRFSKDKSPYKSYMGIGFHHRDASDETGSPGYFLHVAPGECGVYAGVWHPPPAGLARIRNAIVNDPAGWRKARKGLALIGESLARAPRGFDADHPLVEDLRRKDFAAESPLVDAAVTAPGFPTAFARTCRKLAPFNAFVASAIGLEW